MRREISSFAVPTKTSIEMLFGFTLCINAVECLKEDLTTVNILLTVFRVFVTGVIISTSSEKYSYSTYELIYVYLQNCWNWKVYIDIVSDEVGCNVRWKKVLENFPRNFFLCHFPKEWSILTVFDGAREGLFIAWRFIVTAAVVSQNEIRFRDNKFILWRFYICTYALY